MAPARMHVGDGVAGWLRVEVKTRRQERPQPQLASDTRPPPHFVAATLAIEPTMDVIAKTGTFVQEREVVCLKVTQNLNELSPIGRLPAELVILLAQRLLDITKPADVPKALVRMSSVCVRFRFILANEPVLWSSVVMDGDGRSPSAICSSPELHPIL
jgi:hypothetical protein